MSTYSRTLDRAGRLADELVVDALFTCPPSGPAMHLIIGDETHVMARQHEERLRPMLAIAPMHLQGATEGTT